MNTRESPGVSPGLSSVVTRRTTVLRVPHHNVGAWTQTYNAMTEGG
jgi:hypothetical protein